VALRRVQLTFMNYNCLRFEDAAPVFSGSHDPIPEVNVEQAGGYPGAGVPDPITIKR